MTTSAYPRLASITLGGWHGLSTQDVLVIGETPTRYRIRALNKTRLAGRHRYLEATAQTLIPRRSVTFLSVEWLICALCGGSGRLRGPAIPPIVGLSTPLGQKGDPCWDCQGLGGWRADSVDQYVAAGVKL